MFPFGDPPDYTPPKEASIAAIAAREGHTPEEVAYDLLLADEGNSFIFAALTNYADYTLDASAELLRHPNTIVGLSDGGAHVGFISDGSFPTFLLAHWGKVRGLPVQELIRRQTSDTARAAGLHDRGVLKVGMKADINVIDWDTLALERPGMLYDLPAGGRRLMQKARGYDATIVAGAVTYRHGEATGALPGKLVRCTA
jgi:N-acyl-D-aspartate/D-glutamate deacylase